jgi:hypothetical protein
MLVVMWGVDLPESRVIKSRTDDGQGPPRIGQDWNQISGTLELKSNRVSEVTTFKLDDLPPLSLALLITEEIA